MKKVLGGAAALAFAVSAGAATQTTTFNVTATVVSTCTVAASDLTFGDYDPTALLPADATTTIDVTCSLGAPFNIGLGVGTNGGGTVTTRAMRISGGGSDTLSYGLYRDLAHTLNWGTTIGTDTVAATGLGTLLAVSTSVYGRIPTAQNKTVGSYSDSITVTVTY